MHDLTPIHPLASTQARIDTVAGVTLTETMSLALASIAARRGQEAACEQHLGDLLGGTAPQPGKAVFHEPEAAFWTGPCQWMVTAPYETHEDLSAQLISRFGETASITEQTDGWACFDMQGVGVEAVMQLCCNIDVERMQSGDAIRTSIHYMGVTVLRQEPADSLRILGARSSAKSLHHALLTAMKAAL